MISPTHISLHLFPPAASPVLTPTVARGPSGDSLVPPTPIHPRQLPSGCKAVMCVWAEGGCLDVLRQTWGSKDFNLPLSGPHFLKSSSQAPAEASLACLLSGCLAGRRQGPSSHSMTFHFLSLRLPKSPSKVKGGRWGISLTSHIRLVSLPSPCPLSPAGPRARPHPCYAPPHHVLVPQRGAGGCLEKTGVLCLIMEQAFDNEAAPWRVCTVFQHPS